MDRRTFVKRGLLGGGLLALVGGGALFLRRGAYTLQPPEPLKVLDETTFCVLVAAARRIALADDALALRLARDVDEALTYGNPVAAQDFVKVLYLLENGLLGLFFRLSPALFTEMSPADQDRALNAWRDSRITLLKGAYHGLRRLVLGAYYTNLRRAKETGYPGPLFDKPAPPAIVETEPLSPPYVVQPPVEVVAPAAPDEKTAPGEAPAKGTP